MWCERSRTRVRLCVNRLHALSPRNHFLRCGKRNRPTVGTNLCPPGRQNGRTAGPKAAHKRMRMEEHQPDESAGNGLCRKRGTRGAVKELSFPARQESGQAVHKEKRSTHRITRCFGWEIKKRIFDTATHSDLDSCDGRKTEMSKSKAFFYTHFLLCTLTGGFASTCGHPEFALVPETAPKNIKITTRDDCAKGVYVSTSRGPKHQKGACITSDVH